jgi:hypothetical protein
MRKVSSRFSGVTASIASRKATWMLKRTVRNSSLASIMRTGTSENGFCREEGGRPAAWQQFGVSGVGDASRSQCFLVQGAPSRLRRSPCEGPPVRPIPRSRQPPDPPRRSPGQQRPAPGAAASGAPECSAAASHRPPAVRRSRPPDERPSRPAHDRTGAAQGCHIADNKTACSDRWILTKRLGDDFGADSGRITHGDRDRQLAWARGNHGRGSGPDWQSR